MASKFSDILGQAKDREADKPVVPQPPSPAPAEPPPKKKVGRPTGKRSDSEFVQATVYIQRKTHRDAKIALLKGSQYKDLSELTDKLLRDWLKTNG